MRNDAQQAAIDLNDTFKARLWGQAPSIAEVFGGSWQAFKEEMENDPVWDFWLRWYQGMWDGTPLDWELTTQVALIEDDVWEAGPEAIAEAIRMIEREFNTRVAERLVLDPATGLHDVEVEPGLDKDTLDFAHGRIRIAMKVALASSQGNGLREDSPETIEIEAGLASTNPSVIAATYLAASVSISRKIKNGDYPDDVALTNLKNTLYGAKEEICEAHPEAVSRCERFMKLGPRPEMTPEDRDILEDLPIAMFDRLKPRAGKILESDVERILSEKGASRISWARVTNWVTTVSTYLDKGMKGDKRARWLADVASRLYKLWKGEP